jgi:DNA-directed RNA polymerase subunit N (RpoN/RPB10)
MNNTKNIVKCLACGKNVSNFHSHLKKEHLLNEQSYKKIYEKKGKIKSQDFGKVIRAFYDVA